MVPVDPTSPHQAEKRGNESFLDGFKRTLYSQPRKPSLEDLLLCVLSPCRVRGRCASGRSVEVEARIGPVKRVPL